MSAREFLIFCVFAGVTTWLVVTLVLVGVILSLVNVTTKCLQSSSPFKETDQVGLHLSRTTQYLPDACYNYETRQVETCPGSGLGSPVKSNNPLLHGDLGGPVIPNEISEPGEYLAESLRDYYGYNEFSSELVGYFRRLPDYRHSSCVTSTSSKGLGRTSIIITFHNEGLTTLFRTITSILHRTPEELIEQIILVDDFSESASLKQLRFLIKDIPKVLLIRAEARLGLIKARLLGYKYATAPVLTFLDAHVEVTKGWLEPLLERISHNDKVIAAPIVDKIDPETMEYIAEEATITDLGGFDWDLFFIWIPVTPEQFKFIQENPTLPIPSPAFVGGIFSISKQFFERLGLYDPELNIWGGEHLELSFKCWMCGGRIEYVPCSRIGHIYRNRSTYRKLLSDSFLKRNNLRIASVWMDSYADFYYQRLAYNFVPIGDTSSRHHLRSSLNCSSFHWYMTHIYYSEPVSYSPFSSIYNGAIRNIAGGGEMCLDVMSSSFHMPASVFPCHGKGLNQQFWYTPSHEIRHVMNDCLDYFNLTSLEINVDTCHGLGGNQQFIYDNSTGLINHPSTSKCMSMSQDKTCVQMSPCNSSDPYQKWIFYKQLKRSPTSH